MPYIDFELPKIQMDTAAVAAFAAVLPETAALGAATAANAAGCKLSSACPPVPAEDVLMMLEHATARLMGLGKSRADAERDAVAIVLAELHNDARLSPNQSDPSACLVCGEPETLGSPLLPIVSAVPGNHLWLHGGACHAEHCRREGERANACLQQAGL